MTAAANPFAQMTSNAEALLAHARQPIGQTKQDSEVERRPRHKFPPASDNRPAVLAACGPAPLTLTEISASAGVSRPLVRKAVERLARTGQLRNVAKTGQAGRYVLGHPTLQAGRADPA